MKLTLGLALKRGQPNDGSRSAHCQLELEIEGRLPHEAVDFHNQVAAAYDFCREAVERELSHGADSVTSEVSPVAEAS